MSNPKHQPRQGGQVYDAQQLLSSSQLSAIEVHKSIPSTNDRAIQWLSEGTLKMPAVVIAEQQTAGRGRRGDHWVSPPGSLLISLVVAPGFPPPIATLAMALALARTLDACLDKPDNNEIRSQIKWPNDVYLSGRKIAGLLTEAPHHPTDPQRLVIGLGANINNEMNDPQIPATSLFQETGQQQKLQTLLLDLLCNLEQTEQCLRADPTAFWSSVNQRNYLAHCDVEIVAGKQTHQGHAGQIDSNGGLTIESNGKSQSIQTGTLRRIVRRPA